MSLGVLAAWMSIAPMQPVSEAVSVPAEDACLSPGLAEPVSTWLGRGEVRADLTVEVVIGEDSVGFVLRRSGEVRVDRTLSPAPVDCADRRAALGLAIAMALDAAVLEALAPPKPEPEPGPPKPEPPVTQPVPPAQDGEDVLAPAAAPAPAPIPEPVPPSALRLELGAEAVAVLGALPRAGFGAELALGMGWVPWLDLRIVGGAAGGLSAPLAEGRVGSQLGWGAIEVCPGRSVGRVHLRLCAGAGAGALRARGRGFADSRVVTLPWVTVRTGGQLDVRLAQRVALRLAGTVLTPVVDARFDVRDTDDDVVDVREPAAVAGQVGLGVVVRLAGPWS